MGAGQNLGLFYALILVSSPFIQGLESKDSDGMTELFFDTMEDLMTGGAEFNDQDFQQKLFSCFDATNADMMRASDLAWFGMLNYYDMDGLSDDHWGDCLNIGHCVEYFEQNETSTSLHDMPIYEPCNYVSNLAYYHVSTVVCDHNSFDRFSMGSDAVRALSEIHSHLAFGSSFWHGSHTRLGNVFDNLLIGVLSFISYQESVRNLPTFADPAVSDLNDDGVARQYSGIQMSDRLTQTFLTQNVTEWEEAIYALDIPDYYLSFAGIVTMTLTLALPDAVVDRLIDVLADLFSFPPEEYDFITLQLIPKLREGVSELELTTQQKTQLLGDFASALIKLLYAFLWQEWVITSNDNVFLPEVNALGADYIPVVNAFANSLNSFYNDYDEDLQNGYNMFPGFEACNDFNPHSKWHQQAAVGLLDLIFVSDEMFLLTSPLNTGDSSGGGGETDPDQEGSGSQAAYSTSKTATALALVLPFVGNRIGGF